MRKVFSVFGAVLLTMILVGSAAAAGSESPVLTNADVIRLVTMRVSDQTMIAAINEAKATRFELSSRTVGDLLDQGVSASVIAAMDHRSVPMPGSTPTPRFEPMPRMITATTIPELDRRKFDRVYGAGKAVGVAALLPGSTTPGQLQQLLFALDLEISFVRDQVTKPAEKLLWASYLLSALEFRSAVATNNIAGQRERDWVCCGINRMAEALTTLNDSNIIYLGK